MIIYEREVVKEATKKERLIELACSDLTDLRECKPKSEASPRGSPDRQWIGTKTVEEFDEYVRYGWPSLVKRMMEMLGEVDFEDGALRQETAIKRRRTRRDLGNEVDIHRIYQGKLETAWDTTLREDQDVMGSKLVHLAVNIDANAYTSFTDTLWRGAVVMRLYEALNAMGKSVAITVYDYSVGGMIETGYKNINCMCSVRVKDYGDQLLPDKLASMINVGFMRRNFMERLQCAHPVYKASYGRGRATDDYRVVPRAVEDDLRNNARAIVVGHAFSQEAATRVLADFVKQYVRGEQIEKEYGYQWNRSNFHLIKSVAEILPEEYRQ